MTIVCIQKSNRQPRIYSNFDNGLDGKILVPDKKSYGALFKNTENGMK